MLLDGILFSLYFLFNYVIAVFWVVGMVEHRFSLLALGFSLFAVDIGFFLLHFSEMLTVSMLISMFVSVFVVLTVNWLSDRIMRARN